MVAIEGLCRPTGWATRSGYTHHEVVAARRALFHLFEASFEGKAEAVDGHNQHLGQMRIVVGGFGTLEEFVGHLQQAGAGFSGLFGFSSSLQAWGEFFETGFDLLGGGNLDFELVDPA